MTQPSDEGGHLTWRFTRLNRYADQLPENYREQFDPELAKAVEASFRDHIEAYISEREASVEVTERDDEPLCLELKTGEGCEATIKFYGDEAFDLAYMPSDVDLTADGNFRFRTTYTHLDRSGLVFLAHMLVDEGRISVPEAAVSGGDAA